MTTLPPVFPADMPPEFRAELELDLVLFGSCWWHVDRTGKYSKVRAAHVVGIHLIAAKPGESE